MTYSLLILLSKIVHTELRLVMFLQSGYVLKFAVMWKLHCMKCAVSPQICLFLSHTSLKTCEWGFVQLLFHATTSKGFHLLTVS